jgi:TRAP-type mannitol/chloroaromatic compound transport system permease small subunit
MLARQDKPAAPNSVVKTAGVSLGGSSLQSLLKLSRGIDAFTRWTGKRLAWLILVAVLISAVNAIVRKTFDVSSNSWLELQWVLFGIVFLLCSPWTLLDNEHIRIDIEFHGEPSLAAQALLRKLGVSRRVDLIRIGTGSEHR